MLAGIWIRYLESLINLLQTLEETFWAIKLPSGRNLRPKTAYFYENRLIFSHGWWRHHGIILTLKKYCSLRHNSILYLQDVVFEIVVSIMVPEILVSQNGSLNYHYLCIYVSILPELRSPIYSPGKVFDI